MANKCSCRFLESLLNESLKQCPQSLPDLYPHLEPLTLSQLNQMGELERKSELTQENRSISQNGKRNSRKMSKPSERLTTDGNLKQPTIIQMLKKAGAVTSQGLGNEDSPGMVSKCSTGEDTEKRAHESDVVPSIEVSESVKMVEAQKHKFRPLLVHCFSILAFTKV